MKLSVIWIKLVFEGRFVMENCTVWSDLDN